MGVRAPGCPSPGITWPLPRATGRHTPRKAMCLPSHTRLVRGPLAVASLHPGPLWSQKSPRAKGTWTRPLHLLPCELIPPALHPCQARPDESSETRSCGQPLQAENPAPASAAWPFCHCWRELAHLPGTGSLQAWGFLRRPVLATVAWARRAWPGCCLVSPRLCLLPPRACGHQLHKPLSGPQVATPAGLVLLDWGLSRLPGAALLLWTASVPGSLLCHRSLPRELASQRQKAGMHAVRRLAGLLVGSHVASSVL